MLRTACVIFLILSLSACGDSNDEYIGHYSYVRPSTGSEALAEIRKDGGVYLFYETTKANALALESTDEGFEYNGKSIRLSSDGSTLYFASMTAERVSEEAASKWMKGRETAKGVCEKLQAKVKANSSTMRDK